ncbi:hypothetical protein O1Q96_23415 [Streptomyces sp. Qhu-G9]|uniref:hypothetical protein n=1 Tax=Streptomyces sp. Qhu-G9 TaxID=3452799 RepID=UPI0022ABD6E0|nr:hypothetical protein [Streptomyces aurantiacus]WAU82439.1 hypothetical protein O1Q96_23415 [Streptomyces aurantiacus]
MSERLRYLPEIVDDFFDRFWVAEFCGPEAAQALAGRLPGQDVVALRPGLRSLYRASFALQDTGAVLMAPAVSAHPPRPLEHVLLDITDSTLLNPLPSALRVLITQQLTRRSIDTDTVTSLLKEW